MVKHVFFHFNSMAHHIAIVLQRIMINYGALLRLMLIMAGIGYPKFGYQRVIPEPEPKFGYLWVWFGLCLKSMGNFGLGTPPKKRNIIGEMENFQ